MKTKGLKVWIEISKSALEANIKAIRGHLAPETKLWAVVKSNAYGHGLFTFSPLAQEYGVAGFCVDSVIEGATLRRHGITKPILSLGPTLSPLCWRDPSARKKRSNIRVLTASGMGTPGL